MLKCYGCGFTEQYNTDRYGTEDDLIKCPECGVKHKTHEDK